MKELSLKNVEKITRVKMPDTCEKLSANNLRTTDSLILPRVVGNAVLNKFKRANKIVFPEYVEEILVMNAFSDLHTDKIPNSIVNNLKIGRRITPDIVIDVEEYKKMVKKYRR